MLYESLRKLIVEAASPNAEHIFKGLDLTFSVQVTADEGDGSQIELIKGGKNVAVTSSNVHEYVRLYAEHRMVGNNKKALQVGFAYLLLVASETSIRGQSIALRTIFSTKLYKFHQQAKRSFCCFDNIKGGQTYTHKTTW